MHINKKVILWVLWCGAITVSFFILFSNVPSANAAGLYPIKAYDFNANLKTESPWASLTGKYPTGLYAPSTTSCTTGINCEKVAERNVTSCIVYDFGKTISSTISIEYRKTQAVIAGDSCLGEQCGTFPGFDIFLSPDSSSWNYSKSLPDTSPEQYTQGQVIPSGQYRYVAACRGAGSRNRDNIQVKSIFAEEGDRLDIYDHYSLKSLGSVNAWITSYKTKKEFAGLGYVCSSAAKGYKKYGNSTYKAQAIDIAKFLIANKDLNNDGIVGWGLEAGFTDERCANPGEYDNFNNGTCNPANTEYGFQTPKALECLLDTYDITKNDTYIRTNSNNYLSVARESIDDWWNLGKGDLGACPNCFSYFFSPHQNDISGYARNINLMMGASVAKAYSLINPLEDKYRQRAISIINSEKFEIANNNRGYFSIFDQLRYSASSESYWKNYTENHYIWHATETYKIGKYLEQDLGALASSFMDTWGTCTWGPYCNAQTDCSSWAGDINKCQNTYTFSYCALRDVSPAMELNCLHELNEVPYSGTTKSLSGLGAAQTLFVLSGFQEQAPDRSAPLAPTGVIIT